MPAVNFTVRWPDGEETTYYSPSSIIHNYFETGVEYSQSTFRERVIASLDDASERVKEKFGYYCSAAQAEQQKLIQKFDELQAQNINGNITFCEFS